ncbi:hypothetical protein ACH414_09580 [Streptomyces sp. NPDC020422]|uniref:hypothetical protein n=1 Tax=Streptomyces sp. NPDC020422 TaxID=3365074 RepID=UPI0037AC318F
MAHSERWQELFGHDDPDARMTLASTAPGPAAGDGDLRHSGGPWTGASTTAGELRTSAETSRAALGPGHEGLTAGGAGLASVAALAAVRTSWEERLAAIRDECEALRGPLLSVAKEMGETETAIRNAFAAAGGKPQEARR